MYTYRMKEEPYFTIKVKIRSMYVIELYDCYIHATGWCIVGEQCQSSR